MAIEAERGLLPTCYSCLFQDLDPPPSRESADWDPADPRLQMGGYGTSEALTHAATRAGLGLNSAAFFEDMFDPDDQDALGADHVLRAFVGLVWPGHHTAPEMLDLYDALFAQYAEPGVAFSIQDRCGRQFSTKVATLRHLRRRISTTRCTW